MKLRKISLMLIVTVAILMIANVFIVSSVSYATIESPGLTLNIKDLRDDGYGYKVGDVKVFKIFDVNSPGVNKTIYCLKGGPGFGSGDFGSANPSQREYTVWFDMKQPNTITSPYTNVIPSTSSGTYKSLLWLLDNIYVPGTVNASTYKQNLLTRAQDYLDSEDTEMGNYIKDNDIDAIQQLAVWYFTNPSDKYHVNTSFEFYINAIYNSNSNYLPMTDERIDRNGTERAAECQALYEYLITTAQANNNYTPTVESQPYQIEKSLPKTVKTKNGNYVIGPFKVNKTGNTQGTLTATFKNGGSVINPTLQDESGSTTYNSITQTVGKDFYIVLPKSSTDLQDITFSISGSYFKTKIQYWSVANSQPTTDQPVVLVDRVNEPYSDSEQYTPVIKQFDLALRKYITKVNNTVLASESKSRIPDIDETKIATNKTADYKHRKDPVEVKTGDEVTYNITVYNEGEKAGYPMEIIDQLPDGLEYKEMDATTKEKFDAKYDSANNKVTFTRKSSRSDKLSAYTSGDPDSETLTIICTVKQKADEERPVVLTNVAWISKEYDAEDENEITNEAGADRDSEPSTSPATNPGVKKDNMENYKGDDNNNDVSSDSDYYWKGRQDDDDFEKLVVNPEEKEFDLALRKYIVKVNDTELATDNRSRIPNIDESKIGTEGTADYNHRKDPVEVKTGDEVTYNITVYNEGGKAGYATEIIDQLPDGLHYERMDDATAQKFDANYDDANNKVTFTRKSERKDKLEAYKSGDPDSETLTIVCTVTKTQNSKKDVVLTNVAWISKEHDAVDNKDITDHVGDDRDSEPSTSPATDPGVKKDNMDDYKGNESNDDVSNNPDYHWKGRQDDDDFEKLVIPGEKMDLALRKFITQVNGDAPAESREPQISDAEIEALRNGQKLTADKVHPKYPLRVRTNDKVIYTIRVYNEGVIDGYVKEITDYIPEGLKFLPDSNLNTKYGWKQAEDGSGKITTDITSPDTANKENQKEIYNTRRPDDDKVLLKAFSGTELDHIDVQVECQVIAEAGATAKSLRNVAEISKQSDSTGDESVPDRDSEPDNVNPDEYDKKEESQEDDDDFERLEIVEFDLALRKFITQINDKAPEQSREPNITAEELAKLRNGTDDYTTANKVHPKNALKVSTNDRVIYTIRVYNEGDIDGYVRKITDHLPEGLKYVDDSQLNAKYGWTVSEDGKTITTDITSPDTANKENQKEIYSTRKQEDDKVLLKAFSGTELDYIDVKIECQVIAEPGATSKSLRNIAEITEHSDSKGNKDIPDRDSQPGNVDKGKYDEKEESQEDDDDYEKLILEEEKIDLALRKFITKINNTAPEQSREPNITAEELAKLRDGGDNYTTAEKVHPKNPLEVHTNDIVIYTMRVYNEGKIDAYLREVTDYLPEGLKFVENSELNKKYGWKVVSEDGKTISTDITSPDTLNKENQKEIYNTRRQEDDKVLLKAFDGTKLDYIDVQVECQVIAKVKETNTSLRNIAEITDQSDKDGNKTPDRDSTPDNVEKADYTRSQEDDDDYEDLVIPGKEFDLSLRKFITSVNGKDLVDKNGKLLREPSVDIRPLLNGEKTANYNHTKVPVSVAVGDNVIYTIRVYNEGEIDGYVHEIKDHLPQWLEFVINDELNAQYGWTVSEDGRTVTTDITSPSTKYSASRDMIYNNRREGTDKVLLKAFDGTKLDYIDVKIKCKVKDTGTAEKITNIADISSSSDSEGTDIPDRDSQEDNVKLPEDKDLPGYNDDKIQRGDEYIPGQQDDDDFEKVIIQKFDLALRKFITGVNDKEVTNRVPVFTIEDGKYVYKHPKDPVEVANNDIVTYTIRVFNEGNQAGYAKEIKDDIPEGLEFLPDNELNKEYRWKMCKEDGTETNNIKEAVSLRTDYLSKEQEDATKRKNKLEAFDRETMTMPDSKDVKIAFRVIEPNTSDRILINIAQISEDTDEDGNPVEDIDSTPDNDEDGEDDIDKEKVKVKYFDLALEKIVTEYSMELDGKKTTTKTGHKFGVQPEPIVKIDLRQNSIKAAVIKYTYKIKITNQGEIEGYATEITDYIPEGLEFIKKDNPKWKISEDGKVATTDQLKDKLLKPGESAIIEITLKWKNSSKNLGLKQNWAEISKDYNESNSPDIDSIPNNRKQGEDDIDEASVILSIATGIGENYVLITGGMLALLAGGVILIRKFVI